MCSAQEKAEAQMSRHILYLQDMLPHSRIKWYIEYIYQKNISVEITHLELKITQKPTLTHSEKGTEYCAN